MKSLITIVLLVASNVFMTFAWYGHLKIKALQQIESAGLWAVILVSWGIALLEYCVMIPANRIGFEENGGPFSLMQLKIIQEAITLVVFTLISLFIFKTGTFKINHLIGFVFLILSVYFVFKK